MNKKTIYINGNNFTDLEGFYTEADRVLTRNLGWQTGHNPDALNDLLRGGFGVYEYEEPVTIVWENFDQSVAALGQPLINTILEIIASHDHITFIKKQ